MLRLAFAAAVITAVAVLSVPEFQRFASTAAPAATEGAGQPKIRSADPGGARVGDLVLQADAQGQYGVVATSGGQRLDMLVDTGATVVALRDSDARRLGLFVAPASFTVPVATANGTVNGARVAIGDLSVGRIRLDRVDALVLPDAALSRNLLGMSFLGRLRRFHVADRQMVLAD